MFGRNVVIEIGEDTIVEYYLKRNIFGMKIKKQEYNFDQMDSLNLLSSKRNKYFILLINEDIKASIHKFPYVKKKQLAYMVEDELYIRTGRKEDILFNYLVLKRDKKCIDVLAIYFKSQYIKYIERSSSGNIKGVHLVQLCLLNLVKDKIKEETFVFIFNYKYRYYCIFCIESRIYDCCIFYQTEGAEQLKNSISNFIEKNKIFSNKDVETVYAANLEQIQIETFIAESYKAVNLGRIGEESIIKSVLL